MGQNSTVKARATRRGFFDAPEDHYDDGERDIDRVEGAWAKAALYFRTGLHFGHRQGVMRCRSMVDIHKHIEAYRSRFNSGDTLALLHAVGTCAEENLPLPTWLATAYGKTLDSFLLPGWHTSLDEVFQSPTLSTSTPAKAAAARQDWQLGGLIWSTTWHMAIDDQSIKSLDAALEKALGKRDFGVKKTKARELFLMIDKNQSELLSVNTFSRFLEIRRKQFTST